MNPFKQIGFFFIVGGLIILFLVFVLPYGKLLGKERLSFEKDLEVPREEHSGRPILPVFSGLRKSATGLSGPFLLTIEKLGIKKAPVSPNVFVDNLRPDYLNKLTYSLAHLQGTSLPGEKGNSVIFGHSALPYLYSPKDFQTIFTNLDELKFGDVIEVEIGGKTYNFKVEKGGLLPKDATVLDFVSSKSRLTLITCYPPGFKSEKYAVRALLSN